MVGGLLESRLHKADSLQNLDPITAVGPVTIPRTGG